MHHEQLKQVGGDEFEQLLSEDSENSLTKDSDLDKMSQNQQCGLSWSVTLILRLSTLGVVSFVLLKAIPNYKFFTLHPVLMAIAYPIFMTEAILLFSSWPIVRIKKLKDKVNVHVALQITCLTLSSIGFFVSVYNKILYNKNHFQSWHSWFGLAAFVLSILNSLGGVAAKFPSITKGVIRPLLMKTLHASSACLTFSLVAASLVSGLNSGYFLQLTEKSFPMWQFAYLVPGLAAILVVTQVIQSYIPRYRRA